MVSFFRSCHFCRKVLAGIVGQEHRAALPHIKIFRLHHPVIDKRQHKAVGKAGTQLLHQIQRQGLPTGAVPMKIAHIGVQSHAFQGRGTVVGQKTVGKGQQSIEGVQRRTAAPLPEIEGLFSLQDHVIQHAEIGGSSAALQPPQAVQIRLRCDLRQQAL